MKQLILIPSLILLLSACGEKPKVVENYSEAPKVLEPSNDNDGYVPYTPENAVKVMKVQWLSEETVENLLRSSKQSGSKVEYVGTKDTQNDAVFMAQKESFKKFLEAEVDRMESEYPQHSKFMFTSFPDGFGVSTADQPVRNFSEQTHHSGNTPSPSFRLHESLKWNLFGKETAQKEESAKILDAYNGRDFVVKCFGEYTHTLNNNSYFDLTRCDAFAPSGQQVATTAN